MLRRLMCQYDAQWKAQPYRKWYGLDMSTYREMVREVALDQHGLVTTSDAAAAGVPPVELRKLAARGALERRGRGLYRFVGLPVTERDQFAEAVRLVGPDAYLMGDAVLALHGLALVNPRRIRVGTAHRVRAQLPEFVEVVHRQLPEDVLTEYEGIPSTTVAQAVLDCRGKVMSSRLTDAARRARREGLVTDREYRRLRNRLAHGVVA